MTRTLYCDIDGVLCDLVGGFLDYLRVRTAKAKINFYHWDVTQYDIPTSLARTGKIEEGKVREIFTDFLHSHMRFLSLDPLPPVCRAVRHLVDTGIEANYVTCRSGGGYQVTAEWLSRNWLQGTLLGRTEKEKAELVSNTHCVLVEDNAGLIPLIKSATAHPAGILCLIEQPWNQGQKDHDPIWARRIVPADAPYDVHTQLLRALKEDS